MGPTGPPARSGAWRVLRGWLLLAVAVAAGYGALRYFILAPRPLEVRVARIARGTVEWTVTNTRAGSVRARRMADVSAEVPGRVVALVRREGERAARGETIVRLDDRAAAAALTAAEREREVAVASAAQARVSREDAEREAARAEALFGRRTISEAERDRVRTVLDLARAAETVAATRVAQAESRLAQSRVEHARLEIAAPFDGIVAERWIEVGEWAVPGKPLLRCVDPADLYVRADLDEVDIAHVREGLPCRVTLDAWRGARLPGRISRVAPVVAEAREQSRTLEIEVALRPGLSADVEVILASSAPEALRVPAVAVMEGDRVLLAAGGVASARPFVAGLRNWEWVEARGGLAEGDAVIVSLDREAVREGARVRENDAGNGPGKR